MARLSITLKILSMHMMIIVILDYQANRSLGWSPTALLFLG